MADTIDSLQIEITANATSASSAINRLTNSLSRLSNSLASISSNNNFSNNVNRITSGINQMSTAVNSIDSNKIKNLSSALKSLSTQSKNIASASNEIQKMSNATSGSGTSTNAIDTLASSLRSLEGINITEISSNTKNFVNALTRLGKSNIGNVDLSRIGSQILSLSYKLKFAGTISDNTIALTQAISKLASAGARSSSVATSLPLLGSALQSLTHSMASVGVVSAETTQFVIALAQLASAGTRASEIASALPALATRLQQFMATMAQAPQVSSGTIRMTEALAQLASKGNTATTSMSKLNSITGHLKSTFSSVGTKLKSFTASIVSHIPVLKRLIATQNRVKTSSLSLASAIGKVYATYWLLFRFFSKLGEAIDLSSQLTETENVVNQTFGSMRSVIDEMAEDSIQKLGMSELAVKQYASRFQAMGTAMGITASQLKATTSILGDTGYLYGKNTSSMAEMSANLVKLTADMASFYDVEQSVVAEDLYSVFTGQTRSLRQYGIDLTQVNLKEWAMKKGLDADIDSMTQAEKAALRYAYTLDAARYAMGDFERTSDTWHNQVTILKAEFEQLAIVVGTGLINALKPLLKALNTALSAFTSFLTQILNALGKIFGWTVEINLGGVTTELEDSADAADDTASGLSDAADAASDLKQQLMGFDKLNVITTPTDSSSGSSSSGSDSSSSTSSDDSSVFNVVDTGEALYESSIESLEELGEYISTALTNAMLGIDWESIYQTASNFGTGLANFLNGLISPQLFSALGMTIASSLNAALYFLNSFGDTFQWNQFGISLAAGLNSFVSTFDWELAADTFNTLTEGILDATTQAVSGFDWKALFTSLRDALEKTDVSGITWRFGKLVSAIVNAVYTLVSEKDNWTLIGEKIADGINGFFYGMSSDLDGNGKTGWQELGESIADSLNGIVDTFKTAFDNIDWKEVKKDLKEAIQSFFDGLEGDTWAFAITLATLALAFSVTKWAISLATAALETAVKNAIAKSLESGVLSIALSKLSCAISSVTDLAVTGLATLGTAIAEALGFTVASTAAGAAVGAVFAFAAIAYLAIAWKIGTEQAEWATSQADADMPNADQTTKSEYTANLATGAYSQYTDLSSLGIDIDWDAIDAEFQEKWDDMIDGLGKAVDFVVNFVADTGNKIYTWLTNVRTSISTTVSVGLQKASTWAADAWTALQSAGTTIATTVSLGLTWASDQIDTIKTNITTWWEENKPTISFPSFSDVTTKIKDAWTGVKDWWNNTRSGGLTLPDFSSITSKIKDAWQGVKDWWNNTRSGNLTLPDFGSVTSKIKDAWQGVKDWWDKTRSGNLTFPSFTKITDAIKSAWNSIKNWWKKNPLKFNLHVEYSTNVGSIKKAIYKALGLEGWPSIKFFKSGGVFNHGAWSKIPQYASGGMPSHGSLFVAGEAGSEIVGNIGGRTEVLNESQIASAIYSAVRSAMTEESSLLKQQNRYLASIAAKDLTISEGDIATATKNVADGYYARTGTPYFAT